MRKAKKTEAPIMAWQLGAGSAMEQKLTAEGKIRVAGADTYEIFSQEATEETGETAQRGDYFKVDSAGFPYPNQRLFFERNHLPTDDGGYIQKSGPVDVWFCGDEDDEILVFLRLHKGLTITPENPDACFRAPLLNAVLTAPRDAALVIYHIERDGRGQITDAEFNFVAREEFEKTYRFL